MNNYDLGRTTALISLHQFCSYRLSGRIWFVGNSGNHLHLHNWVCSFIFRAIQDASNPLNQPVSDAEHGFIELICSRHHFLDGSNSTLNFLVFFEAKASEQNTSFVMTEHNSSIFFRSAAAPARYITTAPKVVSHDTIRTVTVGHIDIKMSTSLFDVIARIKRKATADNIYPRELI